MLERIHRDRCEKVSSSPMKSKTLSSIRCAGTTLAEMLVAAAVASLVLGGLMVGSVALQRSYSASDQLCRAQADLLRVTDYLARDVRNAATIDTTTTAPVLACITTGDYYDRRGTVITKDDVPYNPVLGRNGVTYGSNPITIKYVRSGKAILREVTRIDGGTSSTSRTQIADNVDNFAITVDAQGTTRVTSSTAPRYGRRAAGAASPLISIVTVSKPRNP
jgi:type II secretory pathway component PulJ